MAYKNVNQKWDGKVKAFDMEVGEAFEGYFVGYSEYKGNDDDERSTFNFLFDIKGDGKITLMQVCGNLTYFHQDDKLKIGQMTRITRAEDQPTAKKGKTRSNFIAEQDDEDTIGVTEDIDEALGTEAPAASAPVVGDAVHAALTKAQQRQASLSAKSKRLSEEG